MRRFLPKKLQMLANACPTPLYIVGGFVRDFLTGNARTDGDFDLSAPMLAEDFSALALQNGFTVNAVYKNTGTVKLTDEDGTAYEFASFRSDVYVRGTHRPVSTFFTNDVTLDARRRDFTVNAIYYDVKNATFVDPLGGIQDVRERRLRTVDDAKKVFGEDGLRLLRLARFTATLGFTPDTTTLLGAKENARLILDVVPERIYQELSLILSAEERYGNEKGAYQGLKILDETEVLDYVIPELANGRGMAQPAKHHRYDVLEHSLQTLLYAPKEVRLACLLHDVGKPFCMERDGNFYQHANEGARIAKAVLSRLKAPIKTTEEVCALIQAHMFDLDGAVTEKKLRRFLVRRNADFIQKLLLVKQADFSASLDDTSPAPIVQKWQNLLLKMHEEKVPFSLKELAVNGNDLLAIGLEKSQIGDTLNALLDHTATHPSENTRERLLRLAPKIPKLKKETL